MGFRHRLGFVCAALALAAGLVPPAAATERGSCLSPEERRALLADHRVVPLGGAMRLVKAEVLGEVLRVRLCRRDAGKGLVYVLTVLARDGKVVQARVDAGDGHWLGAS
ncbi:MAG: hypothetical protein JO000_24985 [Alphaproteobacteria bacterium]|nr:hypothetical protein [Alphaproteobacteria bacterium]